MRGKDLFFMMLAGITGYIAYRVLALGEPVGEALSRFWEGLTFDADTLGPGVELTPEAKMSRAEYIRKGYLRVLPDGSTVITPLGEQYIQSQLEKEVQGDVVSNQ